MAIKDLTSIARDFFRRLSEYPEAKEDLKRFDMKFIFLVEDGKPFSVDIKNGEVTIIEDEVAHDKSTDLKLVADTQTLVDILEGKTPSTEAIWWMGSGWPEGKIYALGWKAKIGPLAWFRRLLYLGQKARAGGTL